MGPSEPLSSTLELKGAGCSVIQAQFVNSMDYRLPHINLISTMWFLLPYLSICYGLIVVLRAKSTNKGRFLHLLSEIISDVSA